MLDDSDTSLSASASVLPGQLPGGRRLDGDVCGERALMVAVLEDAVWCIVRARRQHRYAHRVLAADAASWVGADDPAWPFSFVSICDVLGVDAEALRARLLSAEFVYAPGIPPGAYGDQVVANRGMPPHRRPPSAVRRRVTAGRLVSFNAVTTVKGVTS